MNISHLLQDQLLIFNAQGEVTVNDFFEAWKIVKSDSHFHMPIDMLIDLRDAHIDVPSQKLERIVYNLKHKQFFDHIAFVADRGSFTYAMGRMFCINSESCGYFAEIFLNMPDALVWLDYRSPDSPSDDQANQVPFNS